MEPKGKKPAADGSPTQPAGQHVPRQTDATKELADLQKQIKDLEVQVQKLTDIAGRAQADLQNAKTRLERDAQEMRTFAAEVVVKRLLPTVDNFQRAFQHLPSELQAHEWVKGVTAIEQDLMKQLTDMGLKKIASHGQAVDPHKHEVLMQGPGEAGKITEVFEEGYELNGKVIRPAKVKVGGGT
jgi:molecular chaperone GrpE